MRQQIIGRKYVPSADGSPPPSKDATFLPFVALYRLGRSGQLEALQLILVEVCGVVV